MALHADADPAREDALNRRSILRIAAISLGVYIGLAASQCGQDNEDSGGLYAQPPKPGTSDTVIMVEPCAGLVVGFGQLRQSASDASHFTVGEANLSLHPNGVYWRVAKQLDGEDVEIVIRKKPKRGPKPELAR